MHLTDSDEKVSTRANNGYIFYFVMSILSNLRACNIVENS